MKPTPKGWPRLSPCIYYRNASKAIDWLCNAFGFEVRIKVEGDDGRIHHSELSFGDDGLIMVSEAGPRPDRPDWPVGESPQSVNSRNTQNLMLYVDDIDAHCAQARAAGANIFDEIKVHDYGEDYWADRAYAATDCEGHVWWISQRMRSPKGS